MVKTMFVCLLVIAVVALASGAGDCPLSSQVTTCTPKCKDDTECTTTGGKCCPNLCNSRSCVSSKAAANAANNKYSSGGAAGTYCAGVKCSSFEKCDLDRTTKRQKCVRS